MIDLFSFSVGSVSLYGGNSTIIDIAGVTTENVIGIKVLHEKCGKSGMQSNVISYWECMVHFCGRPMRITTHVYVFVFTIMSMSFVVLSYYTLAQTMCNCVAFR